MHFTVEFRFFFQKGRLYVEKTTNVAFYGWIQVFFSKKDDCMWKRQRTLHFTVEFRFFFQKGRLYVEKTTNVIGGFVLVVKYALKMILLGFFLEDQSIVNTFHVIVFYQKEKFSKFPVRKTEKDFFSWKSIFKKIILWNFSFSSSLIYAQSFCILKRLLDFFILKEKTFIFPFLTCPNIDFDSLFRTK